LLIRIIPFPTVRIKQDDNVESPCKRSLSCINTLIWDVKSSMSTQGKTVSIIKFYNNVNKQSLIIM